LWLESRTDLDRARSTLRIDVISILRPTMGEARITHLRGVS
jgi:hypothetical protein